jgi:protein dpy-30
VSPVAAAAGLTGVAAAAAAAAATAALSRRQHQQQPHVQPALANGNASSAVGGTSTLLDFGFGASAGPAVAAKGMPVRQYMDATVIPVLREGLKALNAARPDDPLQFLADYLVSHKAAAA